MVSDYWVCEDCGYGCVLSQLQKTKGKCPRCNPQEVTKFKNRKFSKENHEAIKESDR